MTFKRALVSGSAAMPQPLRAGDGFLSNVLPTNFNTETDETITVTELGGGSIVQGLTLTSSVTYTLPTALLILNAIGFEDMDVGDAFTFWVGNNQAALFEVIIAVGAGITAIGTNNSLSVFRDGGRMFTLVKTSNITMDLY